MTFDQVRGQAIVFGGFPLTSFPPANDTWEFDGQNWKQTAIQGARPPGRNQAAIEYDVRRAKTVLFGGVAIANQFLDDTWEYDGTAWTAIPHATRPPRRSSHSLCMDEARGQMILFGGVDATSAPVAYFSDTWAYDGLSWRKLTPSAQPGARAGTCMAYDRKRGRIVLHGGASPGIVWNDTWEWNGSTWIQVTLPAPGPRRVNAAMAYDRSRELVVHYGGSLGTTVSNETWEYDGLTWTQQVPSGNPPPLEYTGMVYMAGQRFALLFGGWDGKPNGVYDESWAHAPVNQGRYDSYSLACRGAAARDPVLVAEAGDPYTGHVFGVRLSDALPGAGALLVIGASRTSWSGIPLPLDLTWFGMPGCKLAVSYDWGVNASADAGGVAQWSFGVPTDPGLIGVRFYNQAFAVDPSAHARPFVLSNACEGLIGSK